MTLTHGWVIIDPTDENIKVECADFSWDIDDKGSFSDFPSDGHFGFSLRTYKRTVKVEGLFFTDKTHFDLFLATMDDMQNTAYYLKIQCSSGGAFVNWDGTNNLMPSLFVSMKGIRKAVKGDGDFWEIDLLTFRQAGALTT